MTRVSLGPHSLQTCREPQHSLPPVCDADDDDDDDCGKDDDDDDVGIFFTFSVLTHRASATCSLFLNSLAFTSRF